MSSLAPTMRREFRPAADTEALAARVTDAVRGAAPNGLDSRSVTESGLSTEMMLGLVVYCYAEGTLASDQIEHRVRENPALRQRFGDKLPGAPEIRRFRRLHAERIRAALERVLASGSPSQARVRGGDGTFRPCLHHAAESESRARAAALLDEARFLDCISQDW